MAQWLAGATDSQHSSSGSEALKGKLAGSGVPEQLAKVASHHADSLASSSGRIAAR